MNNISTNLAPCDVCNMSKWGVTMNDQDLLVPYCTFCSGDYANTKEARNAAEGIID